MLGRQNDSHSLKKAQTSKVATRVKCLKNHYVSRVRVRARRRGFFHTTHDPPAPPPASARAERS